jgi:hypothetical protein
MKNVLFPKPKGISSHAWRKYAAPILRPRKWKRQVAK